MKSSEILKWQTLINLSIEERKEKQPRWEDFDRYFRGLQWNTTAEQNKDVVTVNLVYSHLKVIIPGIYARNPKLYFEPNKASSVERSRLTEFVMNRDMINMKSKVVNKEIVQDTILYGTGFSKTTYELADESQVLDSEAKDKTKQSGNFYNVSEGPPTQEDFIIPKSGPRLVRVSPYDLQTAVGVTDFMDPGFVSHHVRKRIQAVKNDSYYKNTKDLQPTAVASDQVRKAYTSSWNDEVDDYFGYIDMYEIWNPDTGMFCVIAKDHDKPLRDWEDNPYPFLHPFDILKFTRLPDQLWGFSEIDPWLPQLDEMNKYRSQAARHNRRYNRKYAMAEGALIDEEHTARLEAGEDGVIVIVKGDNVSNSIMAIQDAPLPADTYRTNAIIEDDIAKIAGVPSSRRGDVIGSNTATEANITEQSAKTRDSDRMDQISEFVLSQMEKVRLARRKYTPGTEIVKMTDDPTSVARWEDWRKEDIDIDSDMKIGRAHV